MMIEAEVALVASATVMSSFWFWKVAFVTEWECLECSRDVAVFDVFQDADVFVKGLDGARISPTEDVVRPNVEYGKKGITENDDALVET